MFCADLHGLLRQMGHLLSCESSWTPKTQPNDSRAAVWLSFWCSTRPSADTGTIKTYYIIIIITELHEHNELIERSRREEAQCAPPPPPDNDGVIGSNPCLCVPKAELKTKNSIKRQLSCCLVEFFGFLLDSLEKHLINLRYLPLDWNV